MVLRQGLLAGVLALASLLLNPAVAQSLDTHMKQSNFSCATCHEENPPASKVPEKKCIGCHGDRNALGQRINCKPNPHSNHVDELYCDDCHHVHKKSELYCQQCHEDMKLKVP